MMGCNDVVSETFLFVQATEVVDPLCGPGTCTDMALEGVEVCEAGTIKCVVTDNNGVASLSLPPNEEVSFTAQKEGYEAKLFADVSDWGPGAPWLLSLRPDERAAPWHQHLESDYPMRGVGAVFVLFCDPLLKARRLG
jgi:hypothetical protein